MAYSIKRVGHEPTAYMYPPRLIEKNGGDIFVLIIKKLQEHLMKTISKGPAG